MTVGTPLTLTATFTPPAGGTLTGTVNFFDGATQLNPAGVAIASSQASFSPTSALSAGPHSITAVYSGDANFNTFTTAIYALTVNATATSISTPISSAGANYTYGTTTNYTAVVSPHSGAPAFTGTVQFFDGGIAIGAPVVPNASTGSVTSAAILLTAGTHTISAQFAGDGNYLPSASGQLSQNIAKAPSMVSTPGPLFRHSHAEQLCYILLYRRSSLRQRSAYRHHHIHNRWRRQFPRSNQRRRNRHCDTTFSAGSHSLVGNL